MNMEKIFELEDSLKILQLEGVNVDIPLNIVYEMMANLYIGE